MLQVAFLMWKMKVLYKEKQKKKISCLDALAVKVFIVNQISNVVCMSYLHSFELHGNIINQY